MKIEKTSSGNDLKSLRKNGKTKVSDSMSF
jgi:hypothetical protein